MITSIEVTEIKMLLDPAVTLFRVVVGFDDKAAWVESYGSRDQLEAFLRGVQAGACQMQGLLPERKVEKYELLPNDEKLERE